MAIYGAPVGPVAATSERPVLLDVRGLTTRFTTAGTVTTAVDGISLQIASEETLGLVGESGSGKTVTALSIARLLLEPPAHISGEVLLDGVDLLGRSEAEMRAIRGRHIGFVFQDPMSSLNPTLTIGFQVAEPLRHHLHMRKSAALQEAAALLTRVGIPAAKDRLGDYPHQFSGGMQQRVMIAMAMSCRPRLLIADEPTTALDVTIQTQVLKLLASLTKEMGTALLLITHDLGIAASMCDRIAVMYAGRIVEEGAVSTVLDVPSAPYTVGLLASRPRINAPRDARLSSIGGTPPDLASPPAGCRFEPRCPHRHDICARGEPQLTPREGDGHRARCWGTEPGGWIVPA